MKSSTVRQSFSSQPQSTTKLLKIDREAFGGTEEQDGVDLGDVDALVVKVDHKEEIELAGAEPLLGRPAVLLGTAGRQGQGRNPVVAEVAGHELRMRDAHAEPQPRVLRTSRRIRALCRAQDGHGCRCPLNPIKLVHPVAAPLPGQSVEIHAVADAEILEWAEQPPVDRVRQPNLSGGFASEPVEHVQLVRSFRSRRQPKQQPG